MLGITDLKVGKAIVMDETPFIVTWNQHSKQARGGGVMKTKLRNLLTGGALERTFQGNDKIEEADLSFRKAQFLYQNGDEFKFMDQETFETVTLSEDVLATAKNFLIDGSDVDLRYFGETPIAIQLKPKMAFEVIDAEPSAKGDTKTSVQKNAKIETGYELKVPSFINKGDKIVINTESGDYVERGK